MTRWWCVQRAFNWCLSFLLLLAVSLLAGLQNCDKDACQTQERYWPSQGFFCLFWPQKLSLVQVVPTYSWMWTIMERWEKNASLPSFHYQSNLYIVLIRPRIELWSEGGCCGSPRLWSARLVQAVSVTPSSSWSKLPSTWWMWGS